MVAAFMDAAVIDEEAVRRELWVSFGSLVRSYVAAAQVGTKPAEVLVAQVSADELELVASDRSVRLSFVAGRDEGYWMMHQAALASDDTLLAEGAFRIGLDSLIEWTGLPGRQPMDAVAEALATLIFET